MLAKRMHELNTQIVLAIMEGRDVSAMDVLMNGDHRGQLGQFTPNEPLKITKDDDVVFMGGLEEKMDVSSTSSSNDPVNSRIKPRSKKNFGTSTLQLNSVAFIWSLWLSLDSYP